MSVPKAITININGKQTQVQEGVTILQAAQQLDIAIPTLCYHKALSSCGACRVCLVEVTQGNRTELKTACNNLALDGMSIQTESQRVLKSRKVIVELGVLRYQLHCFTVIHNRLFQQVVLLAQIGQRIIAQRLVG